MLLATVVGVLVDTECKKPGQQARWRASKKCSLSFRELGAAYFSIFPQGKIVVHTFLADRDNEITPSLTPRAGPQGKAVAKEETLPHTRLASPLALCLHCPQTHTGLLCERGLSVL